MTCPLIDSGHHKCERVLHVDQLVHVMAVCANDFKRCPIYQEQLAGQREIERSERVQRKCA